MLAAALAGVLAVAGCSDDRPEPVSVPALSAPAPSEVSATSPTSPTSPAGAPTETATWDPATATPTPTRRTPSTASPTGPVTGPSASAPSGSVPFGSVPSGSVPPGSVAPGDAVAHCTTDRLAFALAGSDGAAGTINLSVRVTNTGPGPCWTYGYPGLELRDEARRPIPTFTLRGAAAARFQRPAVAKRPPQRVTLALGEWGWFDVTYNSVPSPACPDGPRTADELSIIAPDDTQSRVLRVSTSACHGDLAVSPILPASTLPRVGG